MTPTFQFPREQFTKLATALRTAKNVTSREIIDQQFKLTIRDCIAATPPFDTPGFGENASLFQHRKAGEKAVKRDIRKVFLPFKAIAITHGRAKVAVYLRKYAAEGNIHALAKMFTDLGLRFENFVTNIESMSQLHTARRGSRGRVRRADPRNIVLNDEALKEYTEMEVSHVGRAKAGWLDLSRIAGLNGLPEWISRHSGEPYLFEDQRANLERPQVTFGNLVEFVDNFSDLKILELVFENRLRSMRGELDKVLDYNARKSLAAVR